MIESVYHWHSFVEIILPEWSLLIDPFVTGNPKCDVSLDNLKDKKVIAILVTHGHDDHIGDTAELANHYGCEVITTLGVAHYFQSQWLEKAKWYGIGWTYKNDIFSAKFVPAIHDGSIADSWLSSPCAGIIVTIDKYKVYHAGDTSLTKEFELLEDLKIDLCFLPIWGHYTMDSLDAVIACKMIKAKIVVPIHYNTRPIIKADDMEFASTVMVNRYGVPKVLKPGQGVVIE